MEATPGVKRGVHETVKMLESAGHTLIHFPPEKFNQLMDIYYHHAMADNGTNSLEYLEHDVIDNVIRDMKSILVFLYLFVSVTESTV